MPFAGDSRPIGVFDSGMGGLTVLAALRRALPGEDFLYLGDTARLPYGTKSPQTVMRYALQAAGLLAALGVKLIVLACNTASGHALAAVRAAHPGLPVLGVIEPGAAAAAAASASGRIAVIATEGTVRGGAYAAALHRLRSDAVVTARACTLFVALVEEGWADDDIAEAVARRYLTPLFAALSPPDTLVLGCTHFPVLKPVIRRILGDGVAVIDSAEATAAAVVGELGREGLAAPPGRHGRERYLATDAAERFLRVAAALGIAGLSVGAVELVDL